MPRTETIAPHTCIPSIVSDAAVVWIGRAVREAPRLAIGISRVIEGDDKADST